MPDPKLLFVALPALALALFALWAAIVLALWWQQDRLIFVGWGFALVKPSGLEAGDQRLELTTADGVRLVGGVRRASAPSRGLLLVFGGNAEDTDWRLRHLGAWIDD